MIRFNELRITKDGKHLIIDVSVRSQPYYNDVYLDSISIDTQDTYKDGGPSSSIIYHKDIKDYVPEWEFDPVEVWGEKYLGSLSISDNAIKWGISVSKDEGYYPNYYIQVEDSYYKILSEDLTLNELFEYDEEYGHIKVTNTDLIDPEIYRPIKRSYKSYRLTLNAGEHIPSLSDNMFFVYVKAKGVPAANTPCGMDNEYTLGITFNPCALYSAMMSYVRETVNTCSVPRNFINMFLQFKAVETSINNEHYTQAIEYYNKFIRNLGKTSTSVYTKPCSCYG